MRPLDRAIITLRTYTRDDGVSVVPIHRPSRAQLLDDVVEDLAAVPRFPSPFDNYDEARDLARLVTTASRVHIESPAGESGEHGPITRLAAHPHGGTVVRWLIGFTNELRRRALFSSRTDEELPGTEEDIPRGRDIVYAATRTVRNASTKHDKSTAVWSSATMLLDGDYEYAVSSAIRCDPDIARALILTLDDSPQFYEELVNKQHALMGPFGDAYDDARIVVPVASALGLGSVQSMSPRVSELMTSLPKGGAGCYSALAAAAPELLVPGAIETREARRVVEVLRQTDALRLVQSENDPYVVEAFRTLLDETYLEARRAVRGIERPKVKIMGEQIVNDALTSGDPTRLLPGTAAEFASVAFVLHDNDELGGRALAAFGTNGPGWPEPLRELMLSLQLVHFARHDLGVETIGMAPPALAGGYGL